MSQTAYSLDSASGKLGQLADNSMSKEVVSYVCSEAIPFGRFVELHTDGKVRLPQNTGQAIAKLVGVALLDSTMEPDAGGGYAAGDVVPVLRKGRVYAEFSGTTISPLAAANIYHSSTVATNRGKATDTAAAGGAGVEIADPEGVKFVKDPSIANVCVVELNLPA